MLSLEEMLRRAVADKASDVYIIAGLPLSYKVNGQIVPCDDERLTPEGTEQLLQEVYQLARREITKLSRSGDDDFSVAIPGLSRFRVSTYKQRGSLAAVIRIISFGIPDPAVLKIPEAVLTVAEKQKGLVLVTGPAGGGKSTTLACIIDRINSTRNGHIITIEEPIEYLHRNKKSIVSQREIELDTENYITALRACLRQSPDVILVGEMRDFETIKTAMTAAETGHLVISTLHTVGAANTIDRVIDVFPPNQQQQIRVQLSMLLQSVISQQLVPAVDGTLIPAFEIMHLNNAIRTLIRDAKTHQLDSVIASGAAEGMIGMDASLLGLYQQGLIAADTVMRYCTNADLTAKKLNAAKN